MSEILLELKNINYGYPLPGAGRSSSASPSALRDFSMAVSSGEAIALLGANGCGKSTVLKMLAGLLFPDTGSFEAFGRTTTPELLLKDRFGMFFRKELGILFQNSDSQLFNPTVRDEIEYGPRQLGIDEAELRTRADALMEKLGIAKLAERPPLSLSGGEKRKVAIAAVLSTDPRVLLLDEPTAGLDPRSTRLLMDLILELRSKGLTLCLATHDLHIVPELATRVLVLAENGKCLGDGETNRILEDRALLRSANLVHLHRHSHGDFWHAHEHEHEYHSDHGHSHDSTLAGHTHTHAHGHGHDHSHDQDHFSVLSPKKPAGPK